MSDFGELLGCSIYDNNRSEIPTPLSVFLDHSVFSVNPIIQGVVDRGHRESSSKSRQVWEVEGEETRDSVLRKVQKYKD